MNKFELTREIEYVKDLLNDALCVRDYVEAYKYQKHMEKCKKQLKELNSK